MQEKCPNCGAPMVIRKAKSGKYAGRYFWGCTNFPKCKGIINIQNQESVKELQLASKDEYKPKTEINNVSAVKEEKTDGSHGDESSSPNNSEYFRQRGDNVEESPRDFRAKPFVGMYDMQAFETLAIRHASLKDMLNDYVDRGQIISRSKFRVDYSKPKEYLKQEHQAVCALVLRFLCRGVVTINSSKVENSIDEMFPVHRKILTDDYIHSPVVCSSNLDLPVETPYENLYLNSILKNCFEDKWAYRVIAQVNMDSLTSHREDDSNEFIDSEQRVDFVAHLGDDNDVVIEIDDSEHEFHNEKDKKREDALINCGYGIYRVKNERVETNPKKLIDDIKKSVIRLKNNDYADNVAHRNICANRVVHMLQVGITSAIYKGVIPNDATIYIKNGVDVFSQQECEEICKVAIDDLKELFEKFCLLYGVDEFFCCKHDQQGDCGIGLGRSDIGAEAKIVICDLCTKEAILNEIPSIEGMQVREIRDDAVRYFLKYVYRYDDFREGQFEGIERILSNKDSIVLLPTGSGKSLVYQLASMILPGKVVVVSPLVSLMQDQVHNLIYAGVDCAIATYSGSKVRDLTDPRIIMIYISPERLQIASFRKVIENMLVTNTVSAVAVDEAHCVSEWGHDFRTSYLNIGRTSREIFRKNGVAPVIIALTGTASTAVLKDVQRELNIHEYDAIITPETFDRKELHYRVFKAPSSAKPSQLNVILNKYIPDRFAKSRADFFKLDGESTNCGMVFCPHVNGEYGVAAVCDKVRSMGVGTVGVYSSSAPKGNEYGWTKKKEKAAQDFKHNKTNLLVATKAFGMGIDKPNIRYTVHYGLPGSIESFYQEAGRAGRDGNKSICVLIASKENESINKTLLDPATPLEKVEKQVNRAKIGTADDIIRALYFHVNSFKGIDFELSVVRHVAEKLIYNNELLSGSRILKCEQGEKDSLSNVQKALQRLLVLGIVKDYTVNYSSKEIDIKPGSIESNSIVLNYASYVRGYNEGRVASEVGLINKEIEKTLSRETASAIDVVLSATNVLIRFIYDTIEKGRRRGLREMARVVDAACEAQDPDQEMRNRICRYFESTYSEVLESVLESDSLGFDIIPELFDGTPNEIGEVIGGIRSAKEAVGLRGQVARYLESMPDYPGLLAIRSLVEIYCKDSDIESLHDNFVAFLDFSINRYACNRDDLIDFVIYILMKVFDFNEKLFLDMYENTKNYIDEYVLCKKIIDSKEYTEKQKAFPAAIVFNKSAEDILNRIKEMKGAE